MCATCIANVDAHRAWLQITLRAPSGAADGSRSLSLFAIRKVLAPPGKCINAVTNWDFEFELEPSTEAKTRGYNVHDTYHGCQVLVQYAVRVLVQRGMWAPSIKETEEFLLDSSSRFDFDKLQGSQTLSVTPVSFAVPNTALVRAAARSLARQSVSQLLGHVCPLLLTAIVCRTVGR